MAQAAFILFSIDQTRLKLFSRYAITTSQTAPNTGTLPRGGQDEIGQAYRLQSLALAEQMHLLDASVPRRNLRVCRHGVALPPGLCTTGDVRDIKPRPVCYKATPWLPSSCSGIQACRLLFSVHAPAEGASHLGAARCDERCALIRGSVYKVPARP